MTSPTKTNLLQSDQGLTVFPAKYKEARRHTSTKQTQQTTACLEKSAKLKLREVQHDEGLLLSSLFRLPSIDHQHNIQDEIATSMDHSHSFNTEQITQDLKHDDEHEHLPIHYLFIVGSIVFLLILIPNVYCVGTNNGKAKDD
jgi:cell division protein YceG involved in septum cleavage